MALRQINSLDALMDGAVTERFNHELQKLWENIYDMRTDPEKVREISLKFRFKPNQNRDSAVMSYDVTVKTAPPQPIQQTVLMRQRDDGSVAVSEVTNQIPGQMDIYGNESPAPRVITFTPAEKTGGA